MKIDVVSFVNSMGAKNFALISTFGIGSVFFSLLYLFVHDKKTCNALRKMSLATSVFSIVVALSAFYLQQVEIERAVNYADRKTKILLEKEGNAEANNLLFYAFGLALIPSCIYIAKPINRQSGTGRRNKVRDSSVGS